MDVSVTEEPAGFSLLILPWKFWQWCFHLPNFTESHELLSCARLLVSSKSPICCRLQAYELPIILLAIHPHLIFLLSTLPAQDFLLFFFSFSPRKKNFRLKECFSSLFGSSLSASASLVFFPLLCQRRVYGWLATEGWLTERAGNQPAGVGKRRGLIGNQSGWVERGRTCRWLWTCSFLEPIHYKLVRGFYCTTEEELKAIASNWN